MVIAGWERRGEAREDVWCPFAKSAVHDVLEAIRGWEQGKGRR